MAKRDQLLRLMNIVTYLRRKSQGASFDEILKYLEEKSYIEQQVTNRGKSTAVSYVLWFFLGGFGAHRFYHGKVGSGVGLLVLTLLTVWFTFGIPTLIWAIIDAFLIPNWVKEDEERIRQQALSEVKLMKNK